MNATNASECKFVSRTALNESRKYSTIGRVTLSTCQYRIAQMLITSERLRNWQIHHTTNEQTEREKELGEINHAENLNASF